MTQQKEQKTEEKAEEKLNFRRLLPLLVIVFVDLMGLTIIIPILSFYALSFDASPTTIGLLGAAYPLMQLLGGPILSSLSDRYGRKPILAIAQVGTFLSLLLLGFANALWMLFLARLLDGITGANLPTVQAAISDSTTAKTRAQGLGLIGAAFGLGFILGPALSGIALSLFDNNYSAPAFLASLFALTSVILTTFVFDETLPAEKRGRREDQPRGLFAFGRMLAALRRPKLGILFLIVFLQQVIFGAFQIMFAPFSLNRLGLNSVGNTIFFVFIGIITVVVQGGLIGRLSRRFGERRLIIAGLSLLSLGLLLMSITPQTAVPWYSRAALVEELQQQAAETESEAQLEQIALLPPPEQRGLAGLLILLAATVPISVGLGFLQPSANSLITQRVDPKEVGGILGLNAAFLSLANTIGPLWGGVAFDFLAPAAPFLIGGVGAAFLIWLAVRGIQPAEPQVIAK